MPVLSEAFSGTSLVVLWYRWLVLREAAYGSKKLYRNGETVLRLWGIVVPGSEGARRAARVHAAQHGPGRG
eukprot:3554532-Rhodomonas_salina.2